ncbi:MAG: hypothetical protein AAGA96_16920 [Verrucomicrobiota bacterium]
MQVALPSLAAFIALSVGWPASVQAEAWQESLEIINQVGPEGNGNAEAAKAWRKLTMQGPEMMIPSLIAMDSAGPLARNWMRSAVETVFERSMEAGIEMPASELREFLLDRNNDPLARRLAFDLFEQIRPQSAQASIPGMINDPSPALRRLAVTRLLNSGKAHLVGGKREAASHDLQKALEAARDPDQITELAKIIRQQLEEPVDLPLQFGFLMHWHLIAPFDNTGREGFDKVYPPEEKIDLKATYKGKEGADVKWQEYATSDDYGLVNFNDPFSPLKEVVGYAYTEFESDSNQSAQLRLGCKNAWKIWWNDELIFARDEYHRGIRIDQYTLPIEITSGTNTLLVKACQNEQTQDWTVQWQFQIRVTDENGNAILSTSRRPTPSANSPSRRIED